MGFDLLMPVEHHFFDYAMIPDNTVLLSYVAVRKTVLRDYWNVVEQLNDLELMVVAANSN